MIFSLEIPFKNKKASSKKVHLVEQRNAMDVYKQKSDQISFEIIIRYRLASCRLASVKFVKKFQNTKYIEESFQWYY